MAVKAAITSEVNAIMADVRTPADCLTVLALAAEKVGQGSHFVSDAKWYPGLSDAVASSLNTLLNGIERASDFVKAEPGPLASQKALDWTNLCVRQVLNTLDQLSRDIPDSPGQDLLESFVDGMRTSIRATAGVVADVSKFSLSALSPILIPAAVVVGLYLVIIAFVKAKAG